MWESPESRRRTFASHAGSPSGSLSPSSAQRARTTTPQKMVSVSALPGAARAWVAERAEQAQTRHRGEEMRGREHLRDLAGDAATRQAEGWRAGVEHRGSRGAKNSSLRARNRAAMLSGRQAKNSNSGVASGLVATRHLLTPPGKKLRP